MEKKENKLAVVFPGIGYHTDKPLLYYSKKIARAYGFEVVEVPYGNFPDGVKESKEKMEKAFYSALEQSEKILKSVDFGRYDKILFISKSIGTAVASAYGKKHYLQTANVYYTPVNASFDFMTQPGLVFHGTNDSWAETEFLIRSCEEKRFTVHLIENGNHSLETGDVLIDIRNMESIMAVTKEYIKSVSENLYDGRASIRQ